MLPTVIPQRTRVDIAVRPDARVRVRSIEYRIGLGRVSPWSGTPGPTMARLCGRHYRDPVAGRSDSRRNGRRDLVAYSDWRRRVVECRVDRERLASAAAAACARPQRRRARLAGSPSRDRFRGRSGGRHGPDGGQPWCGRGGAVHRHAHPGHPGSDDPAFTRAARDPFRLDSCACGRRLPRAPRRIVPSGGPAGAAVSARRGSARGFRASSNCRRCWRAVRVTSSPKTSVCCEAVAALRNGDTAKLGALFAASHASMRDDYEISCRRSTHSYASQWTHPDISAARMTGGGFGGSVVVLAKAGRGRSRGEAVLASYREATGQHGRILVPDSRDGN